MGKITDGFAALMDDCATDFSEFHRQVEGIRHRIWRVAIYFANHEGMALPPRARTNSG